MPQIELIPEVLHQPLDPYHHQFDNLPLRNILTRQDLINYAVDINSNILRDSIGSAGTLANRLAQSIADSGALISAAIDEAEHNIAYHTDGVRTISGSDISFVRMLEDERDKLTLISDEATALKVQVVTPSTTQLFTDETLEFVESSTITWSLTAPNQIKANTTFPADAVHNHFYDLTPVRQNPSGSDYTNWKTTSVPTVFIEDTLRVYINGIRISASDSVYVPGPDGPDDTWTLTTYTPNHSAGTFALNRDIDSDDVIRIDFNTNFA